MAKSKTKAQSEDDLLEAELNKVWNNPDEYKDLTYVTNSKNYKKENNMNAKKTIITTVAVTLASVGLIAAVFFAGVNYEQNRQATIVEEATKLSQQMTTESKNQE